MSFSSCPADVCLPGKPCEGNHFPLPVTQPTVSATGKAGSSEERNLVSSWAVLNSFWVVMWWSHECTTVDRSTALSFLEHLQLGRFTGLLAISRNKQKPNFFCKPTDRRAYFLNMACTSNPKVKLSIWEHGEVGQFAYCWTCAQWLGHIHW